MELKAMGQGEGERAQGHGELVAGIGAGICQTPQPMGALSTPSGSHRWEQRCRGIRGWATRFSGGKKKPLEMNLGTIEILPAWAAHPTTTAWWSSCRAWSPDLCPLYRWGN